MGESLASPKVSVIIPVYNVEKYVEETLLSILSQTLADIEIILVNDGSTDSSWERVERICGKPIYSQRNIKLIIQTNKGLSMARNAGLEIAKGRYVYFMDSDDLLEKDALEVCYNRAEANSLDALLFDGESFGIDSEVIAKMPWINYFRTEGLDESEVYDGKYLLKFLLNRQKYRASVCLHFIKLSYLKELELSFFPGIIHEDELFTALLYLNSHRLGACKRVFFKRRLRLGSITMQKITKKHIDGYMVVARELKKHANLDKEAAPIVYALLSNMLNPAVCSAWGLPFLYRTKLALEVCVKYFKEISFKTLAVLLLGKFVKSIAKN